MSNAKKKYWHKVERNGNAIEYTDSDGMWLTEQYNDAGNIVSRNDSFGNWDKFEYVKVAGESKPKVIHTKGVTK